MNTAKTLTQRPTPDVAAPADRIPTAPLPVRALMWLNFAPFLAAMRFNNVLIAVLRPLLHQLQRLYRIALRAEWQERFHPGDRRVWEIVYPAEATLTYGPEVAYDAAADAPTVRRALRNIAFALLVIAAPIALVLMGVL